MQPAVMAGGLIEINNYGTVDIGSSASTPSAEMMHATAASCSAGTSAKYSKPTVFEYIQSTSELPHKHPMRICVVHYSLHGKGYSKHPGGARAMCAVFKHFGL